MILTAIIISAILGLVALITNLELYSKARIDLQRATASLAASRGEGQFDTGAREGTLVAEFAQDIASRMPVAAALASAEKRDDASFASAASSIIVSLLLVAGLAGTLWSFGGALGNRPVLAKTADGIDSDAVIKYTNQVHDGLTGAFSPSLAGIVLTVILFSIRGMLVHPKRDRLFADLERFGYDLAHNLFPPNSGDTASMLVISGRLEAVCTALESNSTNLAAAAENTKTAAVKLEIAATGIETANNCFEKTFGADGSSTKGLRALREVFTHFSKSVKDERKQRKLSEEDWLGALTKIASHATAQETFATQVGTIVESIKSVQGAQTIERENTLKGISTILDGLKTGVQGIEAKWEATHREALVKFAEAVTTAIQKVADSSNGVPEKIAQAKLELDAELLKVQRVAAEAHSEMLRRIEEAVKQSVEGSSHATKQMVTLEQGMLTSLKRLADNVDALAGVLHTAMPRQMLVHGSNNSGTYGAPEPRRSVFQKTAAWVRRITRRS